MILSTIEMLKTNIALKEFNGVLFLYDNKKIIEDELFMKFLNIYFEKSKVKPLEKLIVSENKSNYILNKSFLKEIYEHPLEDHVAVFKNKEIIIYISLEAIKEKYDKFVKKFK